MADIWCWNNATDMPGTAITSSTGTIGDLDVLNIRDPRVGRIYRAGAMPTEVRLWFPETVPVSVIGLFGVNLRDLGTLTVGLGSAPGLSDLRLLTVDLTVNPEARQAVFLLTDADGVPEPVLAAHVFIKATGAAALELGRVWAGGADWRTQVGHTTTGSLWQAVDLSVRSITPRAGAFLIDKATRKRLFTASYDALYPEEYSEILYRMDVDRGLAAQMLFIPEPRVYPLDRWPILGYLRELPETRFVGFLRAAKDLTIIEAG